MSAEFKELEKELERLIKEESEIHNKITIIMDKMQEMISSSSFEIEEQKEEKKPIVENNEETTKKTDEIEKQITKPKTRRKVQRKTVKAKTEETKDN